METNVPFERDLPSEAADAIAIVRRLAEAGHQALLAGGCARDLLLGATPQDYDVATDATPAQICKLFRRTRKVGAQFGVVLVRERRRWIETATFRSDGEYLDGRRPSEVHFCDARRDAERRDFTINGMFIDALAAELIDYVGGRADLEARLIRAIGDPPARFNEDYLRLLRAVRFTARLEFDIEPATFAALESAAPKLEQVAAERVREELEKILAHQTRARALRLMGDMGLLNRLWKGAAWDAQQIDAAIRLLERIPGEVSFPLALAVLLADRRVSEIDGACRTLTCSNEQREQTVWLSAHQTDLDTPSQPSLAQLKRLMAYPAFGALRTWVEARFAALSDGEKRRSALAERLSRIPPESVSPPPLVTGDDLKARNIQQGPIYKRVLDQLYERQLNETLVSRDQALKALDKILADAQSDGNDYDG